MDRPVEPSPRNAVSLLPSTPISSHGEVMWLQVTRPPPCVQPFQ